MSWHEDAMAIMLDPVTFSSDKGGGRDEYQAGKFLNWTDDPRHKRLRSLVNKSFTNRAIHELEARLPAFINAPGRRFATLTSGSTDDSWSTQLRESLDHSAAFCVSARTGSSIRKVEPSRRAVHPDGFSAWKLCLLPVGFRAMTHQVRRWLAAIILIGAGGTLSYCNLQAPAGGELEATLGLMLLVIGLALAVYVVAYPRR